MKAVMLFVMAILLLSVGGIFGSWWAKQNPSSQTVAPPTEQTKKVLYWYDPMQPQQHFDKPGQSPFMAMPLVAKYAEQPEHASEKKVLYWYDPMQPQQHFDKPGKSPFMDMQLLPKYAETESETVSISINSTSSQAIGMRLSPVSQINLQRQITVSALLALNDRDVAVVQSRSAGFVEKVWPLAVGDVIKVGQPLVELLVPEWVAAQQEWLAVRNADQSLLTAASERLQLLGMPAGLIKQLAETGRVQNRYTISAPLAGVIQSLDIRNGMTVMNGQNLLRINGLSQVWLELAVPEAQADVLQPGNQADVVFTSLPAQHFIAQIDHVIPELNASSRSLKARLTLPNTQGLLHPGMSAQVTLACAGKTTALAVPTEAIIRTGKHTLVMVADQQGRYHPQEVSIGHEIGLQTVILSGLSEDQQVVSSAQFLLDSEANLNGVVSQERVP